MSDFDDIYDSYGSKAKIYDKEKWAEMKKKEKEEIYSLIDETAEKTIVDGNNFKKYLEVQSKFEQYSVGNTLLITAQMPEATMLRDFASWKSSGNYPKRNRKDIKILEPGDSYMREDGTVGVSYNVKNMIDISEVNLKQKNRNMNYNDRILLRAFLNSSSSKVVVVDNIENSDRNALFDEKENVLYIGRGAETPKIFQELTQELAKQEIGNNNPIDNFKSYCVSYMICKKYNIDVSNYNIDNIPFEFKNMNAQEIRTELEPIRDAMEGINGRIKNSIEKIANQNKNKVQIR